MLRPNRCPSQRREAEQIIKKGGKYEDKY